MFDFSECSTDELSIKNILNRISEVMLWRFYINVDFTIGKKFSAPYRVDNNPSFVLYYNPQGRLYFKDFGRDLCGDIFFYLSNIDNISFIEALNKVNVDFSLNLYTNQPKSFLHHSIQIRPDLKKLNKSVDKIVSSSTLIQIIPKSWSFEDLEYWKKYGVSKDLLINYNIYPVKKVFSNKKLCYIYNRNDPGYAYFFPKSNHIKVYFPYRDSNRFLGNTNNYEDVQGYYQCDVKLKNKNTLILTKSMKDVMCIRGFDYDSMAINGENHYFHQDFIRHIKKYYSKIVSLYDKDKSGVIGARYLWREYNIKPYFINRKYNSKDISDLYLNYGRECVEQILKEITNG